MFQLSVALLQKKVWRPWIAIIPALWILKMCYRYRAITLSSGDLCLWAVLRPILSSFLPSSLCLFLLLGCPCLAESFREYHSTIVSSSPYSFPRIGPILTVEEYIQTGNYCGSSPNLSSLLIFMMNSLTLSLEPGPRNHFPDLIYGLEPDLLCILATCGNFS